MPFTSFDDMLQKLTSGNMLEYPFFKVGIAAEAAGCWESLWLATGAPGAGANPATTPGTQHIGTVAAPLAGAICYDDIASPATKVLLPVTGGATQTMTLMIYDRLYGVSGVAINATGDKALDNGTIGIARYTDGKGVQAWLELTSASTAAGSINLKSYTDHLGNLVGPGPAFPLPATATDVRTMVPIPLAAGDLGVRDVRTLNVATAATSAVANVILIRPLLYLGVVANIIGDDSPRASMAILPRVYDGACLGLAFLAGVTTAPNVSGIVRVGYG